jgi:hypothetical protein
MFANRLAETGGLIFRDVTSVTFPAGYASGNGHYEQEMGDFDSDDDLDIYGLNWFNNFTDDTLRNNGDGTYCCVTSVTSSQADDEEVDFGDYDNDGDLDAFAANFSGTNWLYQSNLAQGGTGGGLYHRTGQGQAPAPELPTNFNGGTSLDGEWADLDNDDDLDIGLFNDGNQGNWMFRNILGVPDTHAPNVSKVTIQADKPNGTPTVVHGQIRDNGPGEWLTNYFNWDLVYTVNGGSPTTVTMIGQFGAQARGVIPAQTDATVAYHVEVTDLAGNTGVSGTTTFIQGNIGSPWTDQGGGLAGINGIPVLVGTGPLTTGSPGSLALSSAKPSSLANLFVALNANPTPFKCGTLVPVPANFVVAVFTGPGGGKTLNWPSWPGGLSGQDLYFQYAVADPAAICGVSLSNTLRADVP